MKVVIGTLAVIVAALLGIVAASCGVGQGAESAGPVPTGASGGDVAGTSAGTPSEVRAAASSSRTGARILVAYEISSRPVDSYLLLSRTAPSTPCTASAAMESLLAGPIPR